jgi:hypothetical protein
MSARGAEPVLVGRETAAYHHTMGRAPASLRPLPRLARAGVVLYALFLLLIPFTHHDLVCHLKTPQHCAACTSTVVGSDPARPAVPGAFNLAEAGCALAFQPIAESALLSLRTAGRSPPASL